MLPKVFFNLPPVNFRVLALPLPRGGKGAWLGGCQLPMFDFPPIHLLFLPIFLQLCSSQLDPPPHLKRNHPAKIFLKGLNFILFIWYCKRLESVKILASNVDQTAFPIVSDHHFNLLQQKIINVAAYLSLSPWWAINCLAKVPGDEREVNITEFFGFVHHWNRTDDFSKKYFFPFKPGGKAPWQTHTPCQA